MTNFNKSIKSNASGLDNYIEDLRDNESRNKKDKIENLLVLCLLLFGLVGFYAASQGMFSSNEGAKARMHGSGKIHNSSNDYDKHNTYATKSKDEVALTIKGLKETYEELTFVVNGYDPNVMYIVDYGNGTKEKINSGKVTYRYPRAGFFEVELLVEYAGGIRKLFTDELNIADAPEIAGSSYDVRN